MRPRITTLHLSLFLFVSCVSPDMPLSAQATQEEKLEMAALHDAHLANVESIKSMDLKIVQNKMRTCESLLAHEEIVIRQRLVKDSTNDVGVFATITELSGFREGKDSLPPQKSIRVVVQVGKKIASRDFPRPIDWHVVVDANSFLMSSDHANFRLLGRYQFPVSGSGLPEQTLTNILKFGGMYHAGMKLSVLPDQRAAIHFPFPDGSEGIRSVRYFDTENSLIVGIRNNTRNKDGSISPSLVERYRWKELDGIFVPVTIGGEVQSNVKNKEGVKVAWNEHYDVNLEWHSLNKKIGNDTNYEAMLSDANKVIEFVESKGVEIVAKEE